ncbi:MAG TPA: Lrp/AsnC family transcriptional regulator [Leucothrix mucor]|uniref:Lrp/AsnC family transcriptional regulator n=1 Tax=Leucothrix mucor TaxID=45248 RepID=A0A7V2T0V4_LEUMU|nr:Lrp/AsnC family transcriptional regulator [Leucothrix mucor]
MSIKIVRYQHLKHILEEDFAGNRDELAQKLNIALSTLSKYLSNGKNRPISDKTARQFERRLEIPAQSLDHAKNTNVYYVRVTFSGRHPREFLESLHRYDIVKEASVQYGEADIFIKIECSEKEYESLIFDNIRLFPGVMNTTTSQALNASRWQRHQAEYYQLTEQTESPHHILQNYIEAKRKDLYQELHELDRGREIVIHKYDMHALSYYKLLENAKKSIEMTLFYNQHTEGRLEKDLYDARSKANVNVRYKILLFTNDKIPHKIEDNLQRFIKKLRADATTEVYIADEMRWIGDRHDRTGITLTIIDDSIIAILRGESFMLAYKKDVVSRYSKIFNRNWNMAKNEGRFYGS